MIVWLDAQLPPALAVWMRGEFGVDAVALRELGLRDATDRDIFTAARRAGAVLMSKDSDFVDLVQTQGPPPQLIWLTCGNVTNARLRIAFGRSWLRIATMIDAGEPIVELSE
jgi:predicted nuclease of predicted toxin-antitoxin system